MNRKPDAASPSRSPVAAAPGRCHFVFADGRTCRMLRWDTRSLFCFPHAREEQQLIAAASVAEQLASPSGKFQTAGDVNHALGRLFSLRAENQISRREAANLAFIGQLLLQTLPALKQEKSDHQSSRGES